MRHRCMRTAVIFASFDAGLLPRAQRWWGALTSVHDGSLTSIPLLGPIQTALSQACPRGSHIGICLEHARQEQSV